MSGASDRDAHRAPDPAPGPRPAEHLRLERPAEGVARLVLDRPERRNALRASDLRALTGALEELARAGQPDRVVILAAAGRSFCSGFDLEPAVETPALIAELIEALAETCAALRAGPWVTIAAVHGHALAGGCALVAACDLAVVADDAKLGYPVHRIGVSPAVTLPMLLGSLEAGHARTIALGGEPFDGRDAHRLGFAAERVADPGEVEAAALALARRIAGCGPHAVAATKRWLNELDGSLDPGRRRGPTEASAALGHGAEAAAMLRSFWASRRG